MEIKTKRLTLRPIRIGDEKEIHEYAGDKEITMMFWLPNDTFEETADFVKKNAEEWDSEDQLDFEFVIILDGKIIGGCDADLSHSEDRSYATLGWIINKNYRNRGYASEAASALLDFAFRTLGIDKVYAQCDIQNPASFRVMRKIGMNCINDKGTRTYPRTGKTSGEYTCLITRKEWEDKNMDLHDYSDVAENYDLYLDEMYKNEDNHAGFLEFYLDFAREYGSEGVIDIACGTGAVLLYLAEHGIMADGTDLSEAMCRVADEKAKRKGFQLNIFPANMTEFKSDRKYSCAIIARSGFMHLTTPELQRAALLSIRENLTDGGMLTFNTFDPHPFFQAQQMNTKDTDYSFRLEYTNHEGRHEKIYNAISYDPYTQIMSGNWKFETLDENGNVVEERVRPLKMRQTYRQEMKYLLELTGYEIIDVYGGYHKESGAGSAKNVIWCVRKKK